MKRMLFTLIVAVAPFTAVNAYNEDLGYTPEDAAHFNSNVVLPWVRVSPLAIYHNEAVTAYIARDNTYQSYFTDIVYAKTGTVWTFKSIFGTTAQITKRGTHALERLEFLSYDPFKITTPTKAECRSQLLRGRTPNNAWVKLARDNAAYVRADVERTAKVDGWGK